MAGEVRSSEGDCEECLKFLQIRCPPIYVGLGDGLKHLPPATQAAYLRLMRRLVQFAPKGWSRDDPGLGNRAKLLHGTNVRLVDQLARRDWFCTSLRATFIFDQIKSLCENATNSVGREERAYTFAAHRLICLVGSLIRAEHAEPGFCAVLKLPEPQSAPPDKHPSNTPPHLAKILPFRRPS